MTFNEKLAELRRGSGIDTMADSSTEDQESLLSIHSGDDEPSKSDLQLQRRVQRLFLFSCATITLLTLSLGYNVYAWTRWKHAELDKLCYRHTSAFPSPIDKDIQPQYHIHSVNSSFTKETIYRLPGSPEVDAAWDALGAHVLPFAIPEDEAISYGLQPGQVKRVPEQGGGYVAVLESTHHIHCLNVMRQASHWDYDYYRAEGMRLSHSVFSGPEDGIRQHFTHCMDMLRQQLMCDADPVPLGQVWVEGYGPLVFDTVKRKCRNFKQLVEWAKDHQMPVGMRNVRIRDGDTVYQEWP